MNLFFTYSTGKFEVASGSGETDEISFTVDSSADFVISYITGIVLQSDVIVTNWGRTVLIHDSATDRDYMNYTIPFMSIAGTGAQPYVIEPQLVMPANTTVTVTLANNVATATEAYLNFHGYKRKQP